MNFKWLCMHAKGSLGNILNIKIYLVYEHNYKVLLQHWTASVSNRPKLTTRGLVTVNTVLNLLKLITSLNHVQRVGYEENTTSVRLGWYCCGPGVSTNASECKKVEKWKDSKLCKTQKVNVKGRQSSWFPCLPFSFPLLCIVCMRVWERLRVVAQCGHEAWQGTPGGTTRCHVHPLHSPQRHATSWQGPATSFCVI